MLHVYEDTLWALGDKSIKIPLIPTPVSSETSPKDEKSEENEEENKEETSDKLSELKLEDHTSSEQTNEVDEDEANKDETKEDDVDHEKLLLDSFLTAAKFKQKDFKLPVIVSTFMKVMQTCW